MPSTSLQQLKTLGLLHEVIGDASVCFSDIRHDSRRVQPGDLFVALSGEKQDGSRFVEEAVGRGAVAVLTERAVDCKLPLGITPSARQALGQVAETHFGHPSKELAVAGITGTNGKTTVSHLLEAAVAYCNRKPAVMGTIVHRGAGLELASEHTTPEGDDISRFARDVLDRGASHLILEVSSHALALRRVDALDFNVAAFLNLSQDHLDFHHSLEAYFESKARLFLELNPEHAVINIDDEHGKKLAAMRRGKTWRCSLKQNDVEFYSKRVALLETGIHLSLQTPAGEIEIKSPLLGEHNACNMMVALACSHALGLDLKQAAQGIAKVAAVPGRLERVSVSSDISVFVDYAHTPDALDWALRALKPKEQGRLLVIFGCGGDRDKEKRALMGEVAARHADLLVLSNDNPRTEEPAAIVQQIEQGVLRHGKHPKKEASELGHVSRGFVCILDRAQAIHAALAAAKQGDVLLVAGKGHEDYQIIGQQKRHFSDFEAIKEADHALSKERA